MPLALALETFKTIPTLTLVHTAPIHSNVNSNAATPQRAPLPFALPEKVTPLRASQVDHVAAEEIEFFFTRDSDDDASVQARAVIASWMAELAPRDQEALALYYEPEPWRRAEWDVATARRAYAKTRGRAPSALHRQGSASSASEES